MGILDSFKFFGAKDGTTGQETTTNEQSPKKVLVVEDDQLLGSAMEFKLKQAGFAVTRALNGQEGLEKAQTVVPDIILLDILMPVMDGKAMLRSLREKPQFTTTPVIVLTNAGDVDNIKEMVEYYKASDFLIKSNVNTEEIVEKVKGFLSRPAIN